MRGACSSRVPACCTGRPVARVLRRVHRAPLGGRASCAEARAAPAALGVPWRATAHGPCLHHPCAARACAARAKRVHQCRAAIRMLGYAYARRMRSPSLRPRAIRRWCVDLFDFPSLSRWRSARAYERLVLRKAREGRQARAGLPRHHGLGDHGLPVSRGIMARSPCQHGIMAPDATRCGRHHAYPLGRHQRRR